MIGYDVNSLKCVLVSEEDSNLFVHSALCSVKNAINVIHVRSLSHTSER